MEIMNENEEKIRSTVMNLLRHHFGIPEYDAKDILQDAWLLLLEKLATGALSEVPTKLQSYMTTVCTNKAHEYLRKVANQNAETSLDDESITADRIDFIQKEIRRFLGERGGEHDALQFTAGELVAGPFGKPFDIKDLHGPLNVAFVFFREFRERRQSRAAADGDAFIDGEAEHGRRGLRNDGDFRRALRSGQFPQGGAVQQDVAALRNKPSRK